MYNIGIVYKFYELLLQNTIKIYHHFIVSYSNFTLCAINTVSFIFLKSSSYL